MRKKSGTHTPGLCNEAEQVNRDTVYAARHLAFSESSLTTRARLHVCHKGHLPKYWYSARKRPSRLIVTGAISVQGSLLFTRSAYPSQNVESARLLRTRATGGLAHPPRETRLDRQAKLSAEPRTRLSRCSFRSPRNFRFENHASFSVMHSRRLRSESLEAGIEWDETGLPEV